MTDRDVAQRVLSLLRRTPVGESAVLVGSSGIFGIPSSVPALTEDIDVAIPEGVVVSAGDAITAALASEGYVHEEGTATFTGPDGITFDLLGYDERALDDHVAAGGALKVMVFQDLSRVIGVKRLTHPLSPTGSTLRPSALVATKLLTVRGHKGAKDKLQALLLIAEQSTQPDFLPALEELLAETEPAIREDALANAQEAFLALGNDPRFRDAGGEGYAPWIKDAQRGWELLRQLMEALDA